MSTNSLLFHAFGIYRYQLKKTEYKKGKVIFHIEHDRASLRCPVCDSSDITKRGFREKRFRTVPIGLKPVMIVLRHQRVLCNACQNIRHVKLDFADSTKSYTNKFEQLVVELLKHSTIQDVAKLLGAGRDLIKRIDKESLKKFDKPKLKDVKRIAIDEISIGKGHKYLTLVMDIEHGNVVHIGDGKGSDALFDFWKRVKSAKANIEAVATDMSRAYISAVKEHLPNATHVVDPFHIIKNFNFELSELRWELHNNLDDPIKKVLKGTRRLLLMNAEALTSRDDHKEHLDEALSINQPLATAYYLKEELRQMWSQPSRESAERYIMCWIAKAEQSGIKMLYKFAKTIRRHFRSILNHYDYPISTNIIEGLNNKIKTLHMQSYGFRDIEFFKLKIKAIHRTKYQLCG